ncbi:MAG: CRISPR-associated endonuclease Cas2 [Clostridia bacterium]|nr:CRISPR-associated endonuclease Cas2 [Clostridia bacterium]
MYILLVYDVGEKRVQKVLKYMRKHLNWVQNSVFEGEVTEAQILKIKNGLRRLIREEEDSVLIYTARDRKWLSKEVVGIEKRVIDNFL